MSQETWHSHVSDESSELDEEEEEGGEEEEVERGAHLTREDMDVIVAGFGDEGKKLLAAYATPVSELQNLQGLRRTLELKEAELENTRKLLKKANHENKKYRTAGKNYGPDFNKRIKELKNKIPQIKAVGGVLTASKGSGAGISKDVYDKAVHAKTRYMKENETLKNRMEQLQKDNARLRREKKANRQN